MQTRSFASYVVSAWLISFIIITVAGLVGASIYTGFHLKQALDAQHELRSQMADLSLATMTDANAPNGAVSLGEASLNGALEGVRKTSHRDEAYLVAELLGVLAGFIFLRRCRPSISA